MINKRSSSFFLALLFFSTNVLNLSAIQSQIDQPQADQVQVEGEEDDAFSPFDFFQPSKMVEKLPEDCRKVVLQALDECNNLFANLQNPILFLFDIVQVLGIKSEEILNQSVGQEKEIIDQLIETLHEVQELLGSQKFQFALQLGVIREDLKKEMQALVDKLNSVFKSFQESNVIQKEFLNKNLEILKDCINALIMGDFNVIAQHQQSFLEEKAPQAFQLLDSAEFMLAELAENLKMQENKDLEQAIVFWQKTLKEFSAALKSYFAGPSKWMKALNMVEKATPYIEGGYFFYHKFMELYKTDHKDALCWKNILNPKGFLSLMGDQTLRVSMALIHVLRRITQLGKSGNFGPKQGYFLLQQIMGEFVGIYLDPNFCVKNLMWPMRAFYRIAPAFAYIGSYNFWKWKDPFYNYDRENLEKMGYYYQDEKFKRAVWFSLKDGYRSLANLLESQLYKSVTPEKLRKLEDGSFGFVKPELLSAVLDTAMPLLTYRCCERFGKIIERKDVFAKELSKVEDYLWDWNYVGETDSKKIQNDAYFIEGRFFGYLATSLGTHFGRKFTQKHKRPIKSLLSKGVRGFSKVLAKLGFLDQEYVNWQDQIKEVIKEGVQVFAQDSSFVILIQQFFFPMLVAFGIMNQLQVAKFEKKLISGEQLDEKEIDLIIDKIFSFVADELVIGVGGGVGAFISWYGANWLMQKYGPFWPRAKKYVVSSA